MLYIKIKHTPWVPYLSLCLGEGKACFRKWGQLPASLLRAIQAAI